MADHLLVGISHPASVALAAATGTRHARAAVHICMTLRSVSKNRMYVNVATSSTSTSRTSSRNNNKNDGDNGVRRAPPLRWVGQTRFAQVLLEAGGVLELPFKVVCTEAGVHDLGLRCFSITVSDSRVKLAADGGSSSAASGGSVDVSAQQSLLTVL